MSDDATSWARAMSRQLNLKTATRYVLLTLANDAGTHNSGFVAYQQALAADTGMSLTALKSHLRVLRKAQLIIHGDPRMVAHIPPNERPCVYRLNYWIDVATAQKHLDQAVDNSGESDESGPADSADRRNPPTGSAESREITGRRNPPTQTPESSGSDRRIPPTNPLRGLYGGYSAPRRNKNSQTKTKDDGKRLCMDCLQRKPLDIMIQRDGGGFICESHLTD